MSDTAPPLSLRERIKQLEQAAASPLVAPASSLPSSPLGPTSPLALAPRPPLPAPKPRKSTTPDAVPLNESSLPTPAFNATARTVSPSAASTSTSTTPPSAPPSPRLPVAQMLARYNQQQPTTSAPSTANGLKTDPAATATSSLTAQGERPASPTTTRSTQPRPRFAPQGSKLPGGAQGAEAALSAQLGGASPTRSRAGSGTGAALAGSSGAQGESRKRPAPPPRPAVAVKKVAEEETPAKEVRSPPLPARSATLAASSLTVSTGSPAPLLPPRRSSTVSVSPTSGGGSPALPPRPSANNAGGSSSLPTPRAVPPPPPASQRPPAAPRSHSPSISRPSLPAKPTTHDPLSLAAASAAKPYAPPSPSSLRPSSAADARRSPQPARTSPSPAPSRPSASPAPPTPRRALDPRARLRYTRLFEVLLAAEPGQGAGAGPPPMVDPALVAGVWRRSGLPEGELRRVWEDVAPPSSSSGGGGMGREAFARGMWAIDEELRARQGVRV
ncbi:hypothetical protein JCM10450v2_001992 [Rhodotorula kratochvilovae]